jgi:type VI secretion system protein ImpF
LSRPLPPAAQDRLQPALLDRLNDTPGGPADPRERVLTKTQLRDAVLRDLRWLFNATQPLPHWNEQLPTLAGTVLNFGLPPISGQRVSTLDLARLERDIATAIRHFEPRILPETLQVQAIEPESLLDAHNMIEFEIRGELWAQPVPLEILLRSRMDLEAGQVDIVDTARGHGGTAE